MCSAAQASAARPSSASRSGSPGCFSMNAPIARPRGARSASSENTPSEADRRTRTSAKPLERADSGSRPRSASPGIAASASRSPSAASRNATLAASDGVPARSRRRRTSPGSGHSTRSPRRPGPYARSTGSTRPRVAGSETSAAAVPASNVTAPRASDFSGSITPLSLSGPSAAERPAPSSRSAPSRCVTVIPTSEKRSEKGSDA